MAFPAGQRHHSTILAGVTRVGKPCLQGKLFLVVILISTPLCVPLTSDHLYVVLIYNIVRLNTFISQTLLYSLLQQKTFFHETLTLRWCRLGFFTGRKTSISHGNFRDYFYFLIFN